MPDQSPLARLAASTPVARADRRKISVVDTVPGLAHDLAAHIASEMAKPQDQRHAIKTIWEMCESAYPTFKGRMSYNGFWKYITRTYSYHGNAPTRSS